ncbi:MAG: ABC transporter substrate-binding protein [Candidatus Rokubacteria bacterium]|nr:ABC transporter substrate-binding protein [Candidatus Rokubacteria bacterium]
MNSMARRTVGWLALLAVLLAGPVGSAAAGEFKFALILPLTGGSAAYGRDQTVGAEFGVEDVNARGGILGDKLVMIKEDSAADPKRGITAFNKVVEVDRVPVVVSAWSSVILALAPVAAEKNVLLISDGSSAPAVVAASPMTVSVYPVATVDQNALAVYAYKDLGKRRAALIWIGNDTGRLPRDVFKKRWLDLGGKIVAEEEHAPDAIDFSAQVAKIKAANPDLLWVMSLIKESPVIAKQARELGITAQIVSYSAVENKIYVDQAGQAAEGTIYTSAAPPHDAEVEKFVARFKAKVGREPNGLNYVLYLYNAPFMVAKAMEYLKKQGWEYNGPNMKKAMFAVKDYDLRYLGRITMVEPGTVITPVTIKQVQGGKFVPLKVMPVGSF